MKVIITVRNPENEFETHDLCPTDSFLLKDDEGILIKVEVVSKPFRCKVGFHKWEDVGDYMINPAWKGMGYYDGPGRQKQKCSLCDKERNCNK